MTRNPITKQKTELNIIVGRIMYKMKPIEIPMYIFGNIRRKLLRLIKEPLFKGCFFLQ